MLFGGLLIALGVAGYFMTGQQSITALIPAFFGFAIEVSGAVAMKEHLRKHAMHAAAGFGLLGLLGSGPGLFKLPALLSGEEFERPAAVISQSVMAVLCGVFLALCVRSFIEARRARESG